MNYRISTLTTALCLSAALAIPVSLAAQHHSAHQPTYITIDVPGAGTAPNQGTYAQSINAAGTITGDFTDANNVDHGFVRLCARVNCAGGDGTITAFDVPGAIYGTVPQAINANGVITGVAYNNGAPPFANEGFLRAANGDITTFHLAVAANGFYPLGINSAGAITGDYFDLGYVLHGFLRIADGTIVTFDAPGAGTGAYQGTLAVAINSQGTISGLSLDANYGYHGFLRAADGTFKTFDVPSSDTVPTSEVSVTSINANGVVTGNYFQPITGNPLGGDFRGFLRNPDGTFHTFDAAAYLPCCVWTYPTSISAPGAITGFLKDGDDLIRGFLRAADGSISIFDAPGAGKGSFQGTVPAGINRAGAITGYLTDANNVVHGFLRIP